MSLLVAAALFPLLALALPSPRSFPSLSAPAQPRIMTYYADWAPPQSFDCSLFDVIIFAFALPDKNFQLAWDSEQAPDLLARLVPVAHGNLTRVSLSIGGWTGSKFFSDAVASPQNRDIFTDNIRDLYDRYNLDGVDIDWEYPGQAAQPGNSESAADAANMLQFFKLLRQKLPPRALISAAVQDVPFTGSDGRPMHDVSPFSDTLDWVTLMNYDVFETQQPPGPNAPLSNGCRNSSQPNGNAASAFNAWTSAGFTASKIVLGVPAYGYVIETSFPRTPSLSAHPPVRAYSDDGSGQVTFGSLVTQGILVQRQDGSFQGSSGFTRRWDNCSSTPFLRSDEAGQVISYDDNRSLGIKAAWVRNMGLGGVNLFEAHGDTLDHHLTLALRAGLSPKASSAGTAPQSPSAVPSSVAASYPTPTPTPAPFLPLPSVLAILPHGN